MTDIVNKATRSRMMASIRNRDTTSERLVRQELCRTGIHYRLQNRKLPGRLEYRHWPIAHRDFRSWLLSSSEKTPC